MQCHVLYIRDWLFNIQYDTLDGLKTLILDNIYSISYMLYHV